MYGILKPGVLYLGVLARPHLLTSIYFELDCSRTRLRLLHYSLNDRSNVITPGLMVFIKFLLEMDDPFPKSFLQKPFKPSLVSQVVIKLMFDCSNFLNEESTDKPNQYSTEKKDRSLWRWTLPLTTSSTTTPHRCQRTPRYLTALWRTWKRMPGFHSWDKMQLFTKRDLLNSRISMFFFGGESVTDCQCLVHYL